MIYPETSGKSGEYLRLRTLESTWIRGRLKMWGCWAAFSKSPQAAGIFQRLLSDPKITKKALKDAMRRMKKSGLSEETLQLFLEEYQNKKTLSNMWFCSDTEGGEMDKVICEVMNADAGLLNILKQYYVYKKSKHEIALELCEKDGRYCLRTYQDRVKAWLNVAEFMLYRPMCDRFDREYHYSE
ncbi:DUF1133 family protein [Proteus mirabilis]|uniref:DUF1133 family protein n=1 Tax=Proteus TaxID=583 RepID=UPI000D6F8750|nr:MULTISPECIES: DUF1133 family protein [Proteus]EMC9361735.1 DUF1133 family protein [Proteus mirabilis]EMD6182819.1 DUF1133 family protein [Proteus mirabilis]MCL8549038.1 DUF1133 family protein [Proteus mirabilis]MCL8563561.1 DUF1133 family protein [Proteus mirabilis]MCL8578223.1 DUF1133 family protein [Proteus mirabilis]